MPHTENAAYRLSLIALCITSETGLYSFAQLVTVTMLGAGVWPKSVPMWNLCLKHALCRLLMLEVWDLILEHDPDPCALIWDLCLLQYARIQAWGSLVAMCVYTTWVPTLGCTHSCQPTLLVLAWMLLGELFARLCPVVQLECKQSFNAASLAAWVNVWDFCIFSWYCNLSIRRNACLQCRIKMMSFAAMSCATTSSVKWLWQATFL